MLSQIQKFKMSNKKKQKKCQPAASDTHIPDLIQTECVADSGLARHNKKNKQNVKNKNERLIDGKRKEIYQKKGKKVPRSKMRKFHSTEKSIKKMPLT